MSVRADQDHAGGTVAMGMEDVMETFYQAVENKRDLARFRMRALTDSLTGKLRYGDQTYSNVVKTSS